MKQVLLVWACVFSALATNAQCPKLIINEVSNGPTGAKEFFEFVVVGCPGGTQDIRGWIIDDQSGRCISCATGLGISNGHLRFSNSSVWQNVKVGSIIVVYNAEDKNASLPADDPNDANNDYVYIVPHNNATYILQYNSFPAPTSNCNNFTMAGGSTSWSNIMGLRNTGDLLQVVDPGNTSVMAHGVGYGSDTSPSCANSVYFSGDGTGITYQFRNTINSDPFNASNWAKLSASTSDSPGAANTVANQNWINKLRSAAPEFVWQGTTEDGNWANCKNWDVISVPCGTNPNVQIANTTAARNLNLATVPAVSLGNLTVAVGGFVALPGFNNCLSNTVTVNGTLTLTRGVVSTCTPISSSTAVYVANSAVGAVSGGSNVSFINGRLRRAIVPGATNVHYNYPLGRGTTTADYVRAEARFSNTATLTELMGYYDISTDAAMTDDTGDLCGSVAPFANLMTGFWRFEAVPAMAAPAYTMRVYPGVTYTPNLTLLAKRPDGASPWKAYGCCAPPFNSTYIDRGCLTGFSDFKPQTVSTPLPVEGWDFFAEKQRDGVNLTWTTTAEFGVERYEIERLKDENELQTLGTTPAAGFSQQTKTYSFADLHPLRGENRYRIRAVDFDGAVSFSEIRTITWSETPTITIYPNPAEDRINVASEENIKALRIYDLTGKLCLETNQTSADVLSLVSGVYLLEIRTESGVYHQNIFKK